MAGDNEYTPFRHGLGFFLCGILNNFTYCIFFSAAEDIITGAAGAVLLADVLPSLITKATAPCWVHHVGYSTRVWLCTLFSLLSIYGVALLPSDYYWLKLLAVAFGSVSCGLGELSFLSYTSFFNKGTITFWSSGTGFAGISGAAWVFVMTSILNFSPKVMLMTAGVFPIGLVIAFTICISVPPEDLDMKYAPLLEDSKFLAMGDGSETPSEPPTTTSLNNSQTGTPRPELPFSEKLSKIRNLWGYMIPLCVVYFCQYVINSGVNAAIQFPEDHGTDSYYKAGILMYQIGVFLSRSSGTLCPLKNGWVLAIFPILQICNLALFVCEAIFHMIPFKWVMLLLMWWVGISGGVSYVNAYRMVRENADPSVREFALGVASALSDVGITSASIASMYIECSLRRHNGLGGATC